MSATGITAHLMVRDEPLTYYAARSVYAFADHIMLWDTGSTDVLTRESIKLLLAADKRDACKVSYRSIPIPDERNYDLFNQTSIRTLRQRTVGKLNKARVRQMMLAETRTPFFFIVDGDEVYEDYAATVIANAAQHWPAGKGMGQVTYIRLASLKTCWTCAIVGRLFPTARTRLGSRTPGERGWTLCNNGRWKELHSGDRAVGFQIARARYWHFSAALKPWRVKTRPTARLFPLDAPLPSVLREQPKLWAACVARMETNA